VNDYSSVSLWFDMLDEPAIPRPHLDGSISVDVCILGAGFTGLWTAFYLKQKAPALTVAVLEAETAGFGASGRNGGWVTGTMANADRYLRKLAPEMQRVCRRTLFGMVDEVADFVRDHGVKCDFHKGGALHAAAGYPEQLDDLKVMLESAYELGCTDEDYMWLDKSQATQRVNMEGIRAAVFTPHCAVVNPLQLVRGLAVEVEKMEVGIFEQTRAVRVEKNRVETNRGRVNASVVVTALEAYSNTVASLPSYLIPVHSLVVATEPLDNATWDDIGLPNREAFDDCSRQVTYGQRTADGRMIFGARGKYLFGSKHRDRWPLHHHQLKARAALLRRIFPQLKGVQITHGWGGAFGMARSMTPYVIFDRSAGIAWSGGYTGEGVAMANLAGRTMSDLILERKSDLVAMPWVRTSGPWKSQLRPWEPEPLRWIGYNAVSATYRLEDVLCGSATAPAWSKSVVRSLGNGVDRLLLK
jgi:glycine/D-amino acid oxidase-like deaminating enzyme